MKEIQHLRYEQEQQNLLHLNTPTSTRNPTLLAELRLLRQRRDELETRMTSLQDSRKDLMVQLEGLMKLLKVKVIKIYVMLPTTSVTLLIEAKF